MTFIEILNSEYRGLVDAIEDTASSLRGKEDDTALRGALDAQVSELEGLTGFRYEVDI